MSGVPASSTASSVASDAEERLTSGREAKEKLKRESIKRIHSLAVDAAGAFVLRQSPFVDLDSPMTAYEWFKLILLAPFVVLRFAITLLILLLAYPLAKLLMIGRDPLEPLSPWKTGLLRWGISYGAAILLRFGLNVWPTYKGVKHLKEAERTNAILVFNHVSYVDALAMVGLCAPAGVAKAGVATLFLVGPISRALQFLYVERKGTTDKQNKFTVRGSARDSVMNRAKDARFPPMMIAPEGTTKPGNVLLQFSDGAFLAGVPITPILLNYRRNTHFNPGWGVVQSVSFHFIRLLCQFCTYLDIEVLPVYHPSEQEQQDPKLYKENVRQLMADHLGATLSEHTSRERWSYEKANVYTSWKGDKLFMRQHGKVVEIKQPQSREDLEPVGNTDLPV